MTVAKLGSNRSHAGGRRHVTVDLQPPHWRACKPKPPSGACSQLLTSEPQPLAATAMVIAETACLLDTKRAPRAEALLEKSILDGQLPERV
jgi:hypothetical protein